MQKRNALTLAASLAAILTVPGLASAHSSVISCPLTPGGPYIASDDPGYGVPVVTTNADGSLRLTWPDGYVRTVMAPSGCAVPAPVPPVAEEMPPSPPPPAFVPPVVPAPPPVVSIAPPVKEGGVKKATSTRLNATKSYRVIRAVACKRVGKRGYSVVRIRVVWKRDGRVVKRKIAVVRRPGPVCRTPAVTG